MRRDGQARKMGESMCGAPRVVWRSLCWTGNTLALSTLCSLTHATWHLPVPALTWWDPVIRKRYTSLCYSLSTPMDKWFNSFSVIFCLFSDVLAAVRWWSLELWSWDFVASFCTLNANDTFWCVVGWLKNLSFSNMISNHFVEFSFLSDFCVQSENIFCNVFGCFHYLKVTI